VRYKCESIIAIKSNIIAILWFVSSVSVLACGMVVAENANLSAGWFVLMCLFEGFCLAKIHEKTKRLIEEFQNEKQNQFMVRLKIINLLGLPNNCSKEDVHKKMKTLTKEQILELKKIVDEYKKTL